MLIFAIWTYIMAADDQPVQMVRASAIMICIGFSQKIQGMAPQAQITKKFLY